MISMQKMSRALLVAGLGASLAGCASSLETTWYYIPVAEPPLARVEATEDKELENKKPDPILGRFVPKSADEETKRATSGDANPDDKTDGEKTKFYDVTRVALAKDKGWGHPGLFVRFQNSGRKPVTIESVKLKLDEENSLPIRFDGSKTLQDRRSALLVSLGLDGCALNGVLEVTLAGEKAPKKFSYDGTPSASALREFRHDPNCEKLLKKADEPSSEQSEENETSEGVRPAKTTSQ